MPATIEKTGNNTYVLRVSGMLQESEFHTVQDTLASDIDAGVKPRVLAILENFEGWERGEWGNLDFMYWHSPEIAKIAMVGEPQWEVKAMAFAGGDLRKAPMKYFPPEQEAQARVWLEE